MTNNNNTNPTLTLNNMGGAYTVEVDALNLALHQARTRGLLEEGNGATFRYLAAQSCGYTEADARDAFRAWSDLEVMIAWVESGNWA